MKEGGRYLSENTAAADVLISLMEYIPLQKILGYCKICKISRAVRVLNI